MRLQIPKDDEVITMEEIEGLVSVTTRTSKKSNSQTKASISTARDVNSQSSYQSKIQVILILLAFVVVFFIGGEVNSDRKFELKILGGEKEKKNATTYTIDDLFPEDDDNTNVEIKEIDEEEKTKEEVEEDTGTKSPTPEPTLRPTKAPKIYSTKEIDTEKWGKWKFYDGGADIRPFGDYCAEYPNRDIPGDNFPEDAWQTDAVYVNHFINDGLNLVKRVQEAILTEYGHGEVEGMTAAEKVERRKMFELVFVEGDQKAGVNNQAGSTSKDAFQGLVRRLLHAMLTNDTFSIIMGGHSAAAGHGNHFKQSYMMQLYHVLEPVFDRLGMNLIVRNLGRGGLGTVQDSLGMRSMYGEEIDIIIWDSGMTEPGAPEIDLFYRQALLGKRAPVLFAQGNAPQHVIHEYRMRVDADFIMLGDSTVGIPVTMDEAQVLTLPWATRFMTCDASRNDLCAAAENKYRTKCWIEREDVTPPVSQMAHCDSQVGWHPGFRRHALTGRTMAFIILEALQDALSIWSEQTIVAGHPLKDDFWHVTEKYDTIHTKLQNFTNNCEQMETIPKRACKIPIYSRSEFTPRADPNITSIASIVKLPPGGGQFRDFLAPELYHGLDVYNPALDVPEDAIDVRAIAGARRNRYLQKNVVPHDSSMIKSSPHYTPTKDFSLPKDPRHLDDEIRPGLGWSLAFNIPPGNCDGQYHSICARSASNNCLLKGHMDVRSGIFGDSFSGWLVMNLPNVTKGLIFLKMETWHYPKENPVTKDWTEVNNGNYTRRRQLKAQPPPLCDAFLFDYSINGNITTVNKEQFLAMKQQAERVVELYVLLDDENSLQKKEDVEVAIRMRNCDNTNVFMLTHVYWA